LIVADARAFQVDNSAVSLLHGTLCASHAALHPVKPLSMTFAHPSPHNPMCTSFMAALFCLCTMYSAHPLILGLIFCIPRGCRVFHAPSIRQRWCIIRCGIYCASRSHLAMGKHTPVSLLHFPKDVVAMFALLLLPPSPCKKHSIWTTQVGRFGVTFLEIHSQRG